MAQIEPSDKGGKKKKGAQKKMHIHVDFTPMVDMNMLLITFFMLCTTMIKSQTLWISLPSNDKVEEADQEKAKDSEAFTMILDTERDSEGNVKLDAEGRPMNIIYYYEGMPDVTDDNHDGFLDVDKVKSERFLGNDGSTQRGIRKILHDRNKEVMQDIAKLKEMWRNKEFSDNKELNDSIYLAKRALAMDGKLPDNERVDKTKPYKRPVVIIKAGPNASWESVISALDEMGINGINRYQIATINQVDSVMILDYMAKNPKK